LTTTPDPGLRATPPVARDAREAGICVSVVSHSQGHLLNRLLGDLAALPPGTVNQVILTVNVQADAWQVPPTVANLNVLVLRNRVPLGFGANHNQAFARCERQHFSVVNPDIRLRGNPFDRLTHEVAHQAAAMAAPSQVDARGVPESFARDVPTPWGVVARRLFPSRRRSAASPDWVAGAFMVWLSDVFEALGGFDDRYFLYCEDVDICLRLRLSGRYFRVVDSVCVVHAAQRDSGRSLRHLLWHLTSLARLWTSPVFWRFLSLH
jgi:GT2 family glycosyltransferase